LDRARVRVEGERAGLVAQHLEEAGDGRGGGQVGAELQHRLPGVGVADQGLAQPDRAQEAAYQGRVAGEEQADLFEVDALEVVAEPGRQGRGRGGRAAQVDD